MFRAVVRSSPRALRHSSVVASTTSRRFASTAPADKKYTWKGTATRWGLAIGALYWYNTSPIFADELPSHLSPEPPQFSESDLPTVDAIVEEKRRQIEARLKAKDEKAAKEASNAATAQPTTETKDKSVAATAMDAEKSPEQLQEEAGNEGAFNPETGEINWDCPCLGGMAHGPCGEEFKAAFSCFVYSDVEPKGMDCVDKFQHMQDCFRKYPEVYGEEIAEEEAAEAEAATVASGSPAPLSDNKDVSKDATTTTTTTTTTTAPEPAQPDEKKSASKPKKDEASATKHEFSTEEYKTGPTDAPKKAAPAPTPAPVDEMPVSKEEAQAVDERGIPKRSFDATSANASVSK